MKSKSIPMMHSLISGHSFRHFLTMAVLSTAFAVCAQDRLEVNEIEVIKHFDARLIDAEKVPSMPSLPEVQDTTHRRYQYKLSVVNPRMNYTPPQIRPLALRPEEQPKGYRGFLRAGYGIPNAILGQVSYQILQKEPAQLFFAANHFSANNKKIELQKYSRTDAMLRGNFSFSSEMALGAELGYQHQPVYFYALDENDPTSFAEDHRIFQTFTGGATLNNIEPVGSGIHYSADLDIYDHKDDLSAHEKGLDLLLHGEKSFQSSSSGNAHIIQLDLRADFSNLSDAELDRKLNNFWINPGYSYQGASWSIRAGAKLAAHEEDFDIFPNLEIDVPVAGRGLIVFAAVDGGLIKNTFYSLSQYNLYIHPEIDEIRNTLFREYGGGLKGRWRKFQYLAQGSYTTIENIALYQPDDFDYRKFQPVYDNGNLITIEGELSGQVHTLMEVGASLNHIFYDLETEDKPWHLPGTQASVFAKYTRLDKKVQVRAELVYESGSPYLTEYNEIDRLKGLLDLSLSGDYFITENIGAFVQLNNILGNKHERWYRYPSFGLYGVAGIIARI